MVIKKKRFQLHVFEQPKFLDAFRLSKFYNFDRLPGPFFHVQKRFTMLSDLTEGEDALISRFNSLVRRHIKKAEGFGLEWFLEENQEEFIRFFNSFAEKKKLDEISWKNWEGKAIFITGVKYQGQPIIYHAYWYDPEVSKVRLRHSCSVRLEEGKDSSLVGQANRWFHWKDMLFFKGRGLRVYDWGGCSDPASETPDSIHLFKSYFGGTCVIEYDAASFPYELLDFFYRTLNGIKKKE